MPDKGFGSEEPIKEMENNKINLDDYAGDEEDNAIAKKQADNYVKDLDKAVNKNKEGGDDASQAG